MKGDRRGELRRDISSLEARLERSHREFGFLAREAQAWSAVVQPARDALARLRAELHELSLPFEWSAEARAARLAVHDDIIAIIDAEGPNLSAARNAKLEQEASGRAVVWVQQEISERTIELERLESKARPQRTAQAGLFD